MEDKKADKTVEETMVSIWLGVKEKAWVMGGVAPEITPVSYPKRNPPIVARIVRVRIRLVTS